MQLDWEHGDSWTDRTYAVYDENGERLAQYSSQPTLDQLRALEREYDDRLNLWQAGLVCTECKTPINGRFGADVESNIRCWECALEAQQAEQDSIIVNTDPTKAVLSESNLHTKSLCDYVVNVATGCRHGCKFCYVPASPAVENRDQMLADRAGVDDPQQDWGSYLLYRDDLPERLHQDLITCDFENDWKCTDRGRGIVMLSSGTDCYQDRRSAQITRACVHELVEHDISVRILTRSPAVVRDVDLFKRAGDLISVGTSIPSFDTELVRAIEPGTPSPRARWKALYQLRKAGVNVFVSFSPTYPGMTDQEIDTLLGHFRALGQIVVFHEPINPRGKNFQLLREAVQKLDRPELEKRLEMLQSEQKWIKYAIEQINRVHRRAKKLYPDLHIHSWPDRELIENTSGHLSDRLAEMRQAVPAEVFNKKKQSQSSVQSTIFESESELADLVL